MAAPFTHSKDLNISQVHIYDHARKVYNKHINSFRNLRTVFEEKKKINYQKKLSIIAISNSLISRQRRWPEALFRCLATLTLSDFFPLNPNSSP